MLNQDPPDIFCDIAWRLLARGRAREKEDAGFGAKAGVLLPLSVTLTQAQTRLVLRLDPGSSCGLPEKVAMDKGTARVEYSRQKIISEPLPSSVAGVPIRSSFLSRIPIRYRLPLFIGVTLALIIGVSTWAGYRSVKESAVAVGQERLRNLADQLAALSQQSTSVLLTKTATAANDPVMLDYFATPTKDTYQRAGILLQQFDSLREPSAVCVELRRPDGSVLYSSSDNPNIGSVDIKAELIQAMSEPGCPSMGALLYHQSSRQRRRTWIGHLSSLNRRTRRKD